MATDRSHNGESGLVLSVIGEDSPKFIVDVGANDGHSWSNSAMMIELGWTALMVEPVSFAFNLLNHYHSANPNAILVQAACSDYEGHATIHITDDMLKMGSSFTRECGVLGVGFEGAEQVRVTTLNRLLQEHSFPSDFGALSVDAETHDLEVLRGIDLNIFRPRAIIVEDMPKPTEIDMYLNKNGYALLSILHENKIFVNSLIPDIISRSRAAGYLISN